MATAVGQVGPKNGDSEFGGLSGRWLEGGGSRWGKVEGSVVPILNSFVGCRLLTQVLGLGENQLEIEAEHES